MIDDATQGAVAGIREDLAQVTHRLAELKASATGGGSYWLFQITAILGMMDLAHENLGKFDVEDLIGDLLEVEDWIHSDAVLGRFRLPDEEIATAVRARLKRARGPRRERLAELLRKLEYSRELRDDARQRQGRRGLAGERPRERRGHR